MGINIIISITAWSFLILPWSRLTRKWPNQTSSSPNLLRTDREGRKPGKVSNVSLHHFLPQLVRYCPLVAEHILPFHEQKFRLCFPRHRNIKLRTNHLRDEAIVMEEVFSPQASQLLGHIVWALLLPGQWIPLHLQNDPVCGNFFRLRGLSLLHR